MISKGVARTYRLLLGFLVPPISGSVLLVISILFTEAKVDPIGTDRVLEYIVVFPKIVLLALLFTGLQSLVFSIVMEFIARPVIHKLGYFVLVSGILGLLSGLIPGALTANLERFLPIGILVGIFVGLLLYDKGNASNQSI